MESDRQPSCGAAVALAEHGVRRIPADHDPLSALLRQLAERAEHPKVRRWARNLLHGEAGVGDTYSRPPKRPRTVGSDLAGPVPREVPLPCAGIPPSGAEESD